MKIEVAIMDGPVHLPQDAASEADQGGAAGAVLEFRGVVRGREGERPIAALDYEVYEPMASRQLGAIASEVCQSLGLISCTVVHSRGRVPVGSTSLWVRISAPHRAQAIEGVRLLLDRLKRDVPIWKTPVYA